MGTPWNPFKGPCWSLARPNVEILGGRGCLKGVTDSNQFNDSPAQRTEDHKLSVHHFLFKS